MTILVFWFLGCFFNRLYDWWVGGVPFCEGGKYLAITNRHLQIYICKPCNGEILFKISFGAQSNSLSLSHKKTNSATFIYY